MVGSVCAASGSRGTGLQVQVRKEATECGGGSFSPPYCFQCKTGFWGKIAWLAALKRLESALPSPHPLRALPGFPRAGFGLCVPFMGLGGARLSIGVLPLHTGRRGTQSQKCTAPPDLTGALSHPELPAQGRHNLLTLPELPTFLCTQRPKIPFERRALNITRPHSRAPWYFPQSDRV